MPEQHWWRAIAKFGIGDDSVRWTGAWMAHVDAASQCSDWSAEECCGMKPTALWIESMAGVRLNGDFMLGG